MNSDAAIKFLSQFFARAQGDVYISSLPNERGQQPPERHIITRDTEKVARFCEKWDQLGRGLFFCIATLRPGAQPTERGSLRCKANVAELPAIHVDIDFDKIDAPADNPQAYVVSKLEGLRIPPSITVASGGGVHAYWMLDKPIDDMEQAERLMRNMANLVAGDPAVCEAARLMRLPGSTNSKRDEARPVLFLKFSESNVGLDELEDMAKGEPVIERVESTKSASSTVKTSTPFEAYAARAGLKMPVDVEARLAAMRHQGSGESGIHVTQLSVTASLLNAGQPLEEVIETVLQATQAVAPANWNMQRERAEIEGMCRSWLDKRVEEHAKLVADATADPTSNVVRMEKPKSKVPAPDKPNFPRIVSDSIVEIIRARGHDIMLAGGHCHLYRNGTWSAKTPADEQELKVLIQEGFEALGQPGDVRLLNAAWKRLTEHPGLFRSDPAWDKHGMIPTLSGLVDPMTGELHPTTPEHFCTWRVDAEYDPAASCPMWADMIDETFSDRSADERRDTVCVIQEMIGTALIDGLKRQLSKGMILHGGEDCGKSEILKVISGLFGDKLNTTSFDILEKPHGLTEFAKRAPWVLHEAFQQGKWQLSAVVKSIITHNPISINPKFGAIFTQIAHAPIFWGTNHPPQFKEMTRAIVSRFIIIACKQKFKEDTPVGVAVKARAAGFQEPSDLVLAKERSGILNWAIRGLQRAIIRGWIEQTAGMKESGDEVRRDSNLVSGFIEDHVIFDPNSMVSVPDFCLAFQPWFAQHKGDARTRPSNDSVGRAVAALGDPRIGIHSKELRDKTRRYYAGIRLDEEALRFWDREKSAQNFNPTAVFVSESTGEVNREIPASWGDTMSVTLVRRAHARGDTSPAMTDGVTVENLGVSSSQLSDFEDDIPF